MGSIENDIFLENDTSVIDSGFGIVYLCPPLKKGGLIALLMSAGPSVRLSVGLP